MLYVSSGFFPYRSDRYVKNPELTYSKTQSTSGVRQHNSKKTATKWETQFHRPTLFQGLLSSVLTVMENLILVYGFFIAPTKEGYNFNVKIREFSVPHGDVAESS